ncbi:hypothetical protein [Micromonospora sp. NPDC050695]|uniref:hypothetical protein n=1 Tax=Micromonospora sp. NPDC050695 TaxID=3154938 RepID=UPI0033CFE841
MTDTERLDRELASLRGLVRVVSALAWAVALLVMIYGVPIVYRYLVHHGVPKETAWILSLAVDGALAVGLVATPILAQHGVKSGWVGVLRWVAGFATWALNTAESWFATKGPDLGGVFSHSWGPLMMFFAVEAAAYFQRQMGEVINKKRTALDDGAARRAAELAELTALKDQVRRLTVEKADVDRREREAVERAAAVEADAELEIASTKSTNDATVAALTAERDALRAETVTLEAALNNAEERHNAALTETRNALKARHTEAMARLRAELSTTNLNDFRSTKGGAGGGSGRRGAAGGVISDEDAVQKLLAHNGSAEHEWSQAEVRRVTGVGFPRAKELINALAEHHRNAAALRTTSRETASPVEAAVTLTADDKEDHQVA